MNWKRLRKDKALSGSHLLKNNIGLAILPAAYLVFGVLLLTACEVTLAIISGELPDFLLCITYLIFIFCFPEETLYIYLWQPL
jgi:hypothetical protein